MASAHDPRHGRRRLPRQTGRRSQTLGCNQTERNESNAQNSRLKRLKDLVASVPEIRTLLARLLLVANSNRTFIFAWSIWRRSHQAQAAEAHYRYRSGFNMQL